MQTAQPVGGASREGTSLQSATCFGPSTQRAATDVPRPSSALVVFAALDRRYLSSQRGDAGDFPELRTAVSALERAGVSVVTCSGHTRTEIEMVRQQMEIRAPFVSENGAALFVPAGYFPFAVEATRQVPGYDVIEFGVRYDELVSRLRRVARGLAIEIVSLGDMTIEEVAADLRLPLLEARLATLREYTELFRVLDDRPASRGRLFRALRATGLTCLRGDRYDLLTGVSDRSLALETAHRLLQRARGRVVRIGIGSRAEDLPMLAQTDIRILIKDEASSIPLKALAQMPAVHFIEEPGVAGWVEAITRVAASAYRMPL